MTKKIGAVVLGGTGFGASEVVRLLSTHPIVEVAAVVSSSSGGMPVSDSHPNLQGICDLKFEDSFKPELLSSYSEKVLFSALPHGVSAEVLATLVPTCLKAGIKVIDLSGDYRLKDKALHNTYYCTSNRSEELASLAVYGIPEINREKIKKANFVANPGCNASACIFSLLPLSEDLIDGSVVFDIKTGISGAGRTANELTHFSFRNGDVKAYKVLAHRHEPEVRQAVSLTGTKTFLVPHLVPTNRGILVTTYFSSSAADKLVQIFKDFYKEEPFVRFREDGVALRNVVGSNFCDVSVDVRGEQVVVVSAIDNMLKGMAGVALHNMNLMFGLDEKEGIQAAPIGLV